MRVLLSVLLVLIALPAAGADLAACAAIAADGERLACYDTLAGRLQPQSAPPATEATAASPTPAPASPPAASAVKDTAASFGAEQLPAKAEEDKGPDLIESTLIGSFKGWDKDSVFELANGQVWRCVECRAVYYVRESPKVTIKRNFLGSYWFKVEGLNQQARVRRVR
ncbi:MAG: hypothetical protein WC809_07020 [Sinimarinibacterium sp.]|jgi:hypothetical protein